MNNQFDIAVIGAGLAGLAAALRLKHAGNNVIVLEKNNTYGGKMQAFSKMGYRWDNGPSLFTEPFRIDELFSLFDRDPRDYFNYKKYDETCRYFFNSGKSITLFSDKKKSIQEISAKVNANESERYLQYLNSAKSDYAGIGNLFLNEEKPKWHHYLRSKYLKHYPFFVSKKMRKPLDNYNRRMFDSEELQLIFNRFATYNGSDPYKASGLYSMISSLELNHGTFFPVGGMRSIVDALYKLAIEVGIQFEFDFEAKIDKKANHFMIDGKTQYSVEKVVCAMDHYQFRSKVLQESKTLKPIKNLSSSGLVFYWGINVNLDQFGLHNILFGEDYKAEFESIFDDKKNSHAPTIYIHISSVIEAQDAPKEGMNLFVMINTSAYDNPSPDYIEKMRSYVIEAIKKHTGVDITDHIVVEDHWDNQKIESITGSTNGALYGQDSNSLSSTFKRQGNKDNEIDDLYYCGGTVHPGGGIPLVTRSAKIVSDLINESK